MGKKVIIFIGFTLLALLAQVYLVSWMTIEGIRPDFLLLVVIFVSRFEGKVVGQLFGFSVGLLTDAIGIGSFLGLSALSKTVSGFLGGFLKGQRSKMSPFSFHALNLFFIFLHFMIVFLVNYKGTDLGTQFIVLRYVLPSTLYTGVFYIIVDSILMLQKR